ncbi:hypothetical protein ACVIHH_000128 [Bradyrhizobium sp. USDA 4518]
MPTDFGLAGNAGHSGVADAKLPIVPLTRKRCDEVVVGLKALNLELYGVRFG